MTKRQLGTIFLILGVLVWPLGWWILPVFDIQLPSVPHLLVAHLCGVLPGALLRGRKIVERLSR